MFIHITPKKVNKMSDLAISATFRHQGVEYEERYRSRADFIKAVKRKKDEFINLVDLNSMVVIKRDGLRGYLNQS